MARWFQYQAKTEGLVVLAAIVCATTMTSEVVFPRSIIYQSIAYTPFVEAAPPVEVVVGVPSSVGVGVSFKHQRQYQIKTEPVFIPAEEIVYAPYSLDTNISYERQWQYQAKVDAVFIPPAETITVDKWYEPLSEPTRRKPFINQRDNDPPTYPYSSVDTVYAPLSLHTDIKFRRLLQYQARAEAVFVPSVETITVDKWFEPFSEPTRRKQFINQQDNNPQLFAVTNPANTVYVPSGGNVGVKFKRQWQYQVRTEPVFVSAPETITEDKWHQAWSTPVRTRRLAVAQRQSLAWGVFTVTPEVITEDKWHYSWSEPVRTKRLATAHQQALAWDTSTPTPETITEDKWHQAWSSPVRIRPKVVFQQNLAWTPIEIAPETITEDKWHQTWSQPVRTKKLATAHQQALAWSGFTPTAAAPAVFYPFVGGDTGLTFQKTIVYQEVAQALSPESSLFWGRAWAEPIRVKPRVPQYQTLAWSGVTPVIQPPAVEESKWHQAWSEPVRFKRLATAQRQALAWGFVTPTVVTAVAPASISTSVNFPRSIIYQSKTWTPIPIAAPVPVIQPLGIQGDTGLIFSKKVIYQASADAGSDEVNTFWFTPWSEPVRQKRGLGNYLQQTLTWSRFVEVPVPRTSNVTTTGQVVFPRSIIYQSKAETPLIIVPEVIREDKWHQPWSEPVRTRRLPTSEHQFLVWSGFTPAPPPPVVIVPFTEGDTGLIFRKKVIYQASTDAGSPEIHEFWFEPWSEPVREQIGLKRRHLYQALTWPSRFIPPEVITEDKWHQAWSEPVRIKRKVAFQQDLAWAAINIAPGLSEDRWHQAWSLPVKLKYQFRTDLQQAFTEAPPEANFFRNMAWFAPLTEPVRLKKGTPVQLQQAFGTPPHYPIFFRTIPWFAPLNEPVRLKKGLGSRYQQFWVLGREIVVPPTTITLNATETNNDTAFFAITVLYNRPVTAVVSIKEVKRHDDAYASIEET